MRKKRMKLPAMKPHKQILSNKVVQQEKSRERLREFA